MRKLYNVSFRCYYGTPGNHTTHRQTMTLGDIPRWLDAYLFTHPEVQSISVKVWMTDELEEI